MSKRGKPQSHYVVTWREAPRDTKDPKDQVVTLKVRSIAPSDLGPTFIALSDFDLDQDGPIIDPGLDGLRVRYADTKRLHVSIYSVLSVEEVGRRNRGLDLGDRTNLVPLHPTRPS